VFDGIDSPVTQSFGLAIFEELSPAALDVIERFFRDRRAPVLHEVSPFAGVAALGMLCTRNYRPTEMSNVLCRPVERLTAGQQSAVSVRVIVREEAQMWSDISAKGWSHEHPQLCNFLLDLGAAGVLCIHDGVALFGGSATVPELRRRGQAALLHKRMSYAFEHGCDLAMMVAQPGSGSQRNAERNGFRIAYTRTKWRLCS
jgi:hypothetical protein